MNDKDYMHIDKRDCIRPSINIDTDEKWPADWGTAVILLWQVLNSHKAADDVMADLANRLADLLPEAGCPYEGECNNGCVSCDGITALERYDNLIGRKNRG